MGYALRRLWLPQGVASLLWNQWQVCRGMRGNFAMESVASFAWNRWQLSYGTGGNFRAEYAHRLGHNAVVHQGLQCSQNVFRSCYTLEWQKTIGEVEHIAVCPLPQTSLDEASSGQKGFHGRHLTFT